MGVQHEAGKSAGYERPEVFIIDMVANPEDDDGEREVSTLYTVMDHSPPTHDVIEFKARQLLIFILPVFVR
jgi:hypothetical protein